MWIELDRHGEHIGPWLARSQCRELDTSTTPVNRMRVAGYSKAWLEGGPLRLGGVGTPRCACVTALSPGATSGATSRSAASILGRPQSHRSARLFWRERRSWCRLTAPECYRAPRS